MAFCKNAMVHEELRGLDEVLPLSDVRIMARLSSVQIAGHCSEKLSHRPCAVSYHKARICLENDVLLADRYALGTPTVEA